MILSLAAFSIYLLNPLTTSKSTPVDKVVELKDDGFHPSDLTITQGQTVKFISSRSGYFWPASDFHPTHTLYPEFDPKRPISAKDSWSFTFGKIGRWAFHDHLSPYFTGVVTVVGALPDSSKVDCSKNSNSVDCWEAKLLSTLNTKGVAATYDEVASLYDSDPDFPRECHSIAHNIGIASYKFFLQNKDSILTPKAAYCANGFYHGFMEALLGATKDVGLAKSVCDYIGEKLNSQAPDASLQCYHGIGHGAIEQTIADAKGPQNETTLLGPALQLCEKASTKDEQLYRCASGAFNGIANFYIHGQHNLTPNKNDPLWVCNIQEDRFKEACLGNMNALLFWLAESDLAKALHFLDGINDSKLQSKTTEYLSGNAGLYAKSDPTKMVNICRAWNEKMVTPCLDGLAHGLLEHGTPGREYQDALNLCRAPVMTGDERTECFRYTLTGLHGWYSESKVNDICKSVETNYQPYCQPHT